MRRHLFPLSFVFAALLGAGADPATADVLVDDFGSGGFSRAFAATPAGAAFGPHEQAGSMAGGARASWLYTRALDPESAGLGALVDIAPGSFEFRSNLGLGHRLEWSYGATYVGSLGRMDLDFSREQALRFSFGEVPRGLNFNVLLYYDNRIDNYSQLGVNIAPRTTPFDVDFAMADFASVVRRPDLGADLSHVTGIYIVSQSGGFLAGGGEGWRLNAIRAVSAVPEPGTGGLMLVGAGLLGWRARRRAPTAGKSLLALACATGLCGAAQAALIDRGGGMIYDTSRNLTWLADMNQAFTSGYAAANEGLSGLALVASDGQMNWHAAVAWAEQLVYGGYSDWRLPTVDPADRSCTGGAVGAGYNCTGGELSGLFVTDLGYNDGPLLTTADDTPLQIANQALFRQVQAGHYWSGTEQRPGLAYDFSTTIGYQAYDFAFIPSKYAVAVRAGDVTATVPEPPTMALAALACVAGLAARRRGSTARRDQRGAQPPGVASARSMRRRPTRAFGTGESNHMRTSSSSPMPCM